MHIAGKTTNNESLEDKNFNVVAEDSYRLSRKVEMLQWAEEFHPEQHNKGAFYKYTKIWSETPIDSTKFRNRNVGVDNPNLSIWPYTSSMVKAK